MALGKCAPPAALDEPLVARWRCCSVYAPKAPRPRATSQRPTPNHAKATRQGPTAEGPNAEGEEVDPEEDPVDDDEELTATPAEDLLKVLMSNMLILKRLIL